jgi:hypothetical protein
MHRSASSLAYSVKTANCAMQYDFQPRRSCAGAPKVSLCGEVEILDVRRSRAGAVTIVTGAPQSGENARGGIDRLESERLAVLAFR